MTEDSISHHCHAKGSCQSLFCKKLNNSRPDVFVNMVTSHHCFHWERCHLWSNLVVILSSTCGILTNGHVLIGRPLNVHVHPAACACVHTVDHVKFETTKIYSQGILVNYAKIYTSKNFLLYSSAIATAALTRWFVVYRSTGKGHTNFPLPLSTVILWQVLTATGFAALHVCSLLKGTLCHPLFMSQALSASVFDYDCLVYMMLTLHIVKLLGLPFLRLNIDVCVCCMLP